MLSSIGILIALDAIQAEGMAGSRLMAMLSNAIYDAVNSFEHT